jgi:hypothetical protein
MSDGMPFYMEKGSTWQFFDMFFSNGSSQRVCDKLLTLESLWTRPHFTSFADDFPPSASGRTAAFANWFKLIVEHANKDWFGLPLDQTSPTYPDAGASTSYATAQNAWGAGNMTTGFWKNWYGKAESVVRMGFIRAIEVSLGLTHPPAPTSPRSKSSHRKTTSTSPGVSRSTSSATGPSSSSGGAGSPRSRRRSRGARTTCHRGAKRTAASSSRG